MIHRIISILLVLLVSVPTASRAEDIDLFTGTSGSITASNLLVIIANAANFGSSTTVAGSTCTIGGATNTLSGTPGGVEQCALYNVINSISVTSTATINVGIMVYNSANVVNYLGADCAAGGAGGCLVYPLTGLTTATKPTLLSYIASWKANNSGTGKWIKASSDATAGVMQEAWAYYTGRTGLSGTNYSTNAPAVNCKNYILYIGNATTNSSNPGDSGNSDQSPEVALKGGNSNSNKNAFPAATIPETTLITNTANDQITACGTLTGMPNNHNNDGYYADEWARYMRGSSLKITTYTAALVLPGSCKPDIPWLMQSTASHGGGQYFSASDYASLAAAVNTVVSEVRSVNSVFAAVTLPVSTNQQSTFLNQIFIGMFRPNEDGQPRWFGNLKQYRAQYVNGVLRTVDADGASAVSSTGSEFVSVCARSYWTPAKTTTGDGYWTTYTDANCAGYPAASNSPDGNLVEKGGQGYMLRKTAPNTRVVKTCSTTMSSCTTLTDFSTSNTALTAAAMSLTGASGEPSVSDLINWARGANNKSPGEVGALNGASLTSTNMRPSVHGGIVHSRPAALNFGNDTERKVMVFYGGDDGVFRAINGNRTTTFSIGGVDVAAGDEAWAFVPPEFYGNYKRLYSNSPGISSTNRKGYGMDGPVTSYKETSGSDGIIFAGMRRGGRALYAFTVNGTSRAVSLRWKRGCADSGTSNCTNDSNGDWRDIGQTWGTPQIFKSQATTTTPLLVMGGGYDATCEDPISYSTCTTPIGNKIYIANANTGALLQTFTTVRSVTADVTVATDTTTGYAQFIYAVDLAGNIYRISGPLVGGVYTPIGTNAASTWVMKTVATLGCDTGLACSSPPNRKFMNAPEVVLDGSTYWLFVGSGDRERPMNTANATRNYMFAVKDRPDLGDAHVADTANCGVGTSSLCLGSLHAFDLGATPTSEQLAAKPKGYAIRLPVNEQAVNAAVSAFGVVYYSTHLPRPSSSNSCSPNLGDLTPRKFKYLDASLTNIFTTRSDAGLASDSVIGRLLLDNGTNESTGEVPICIGCEGPLETTQLTAPSTSNSPAKIRSYWFIRK